MGLSINREKVIKGLKLHGDSKADCDECPYRNGESPGYRCLEKLCKDAIFLLKEQEAVEPILEQDSMVCGVCGHEVIWQKMLGDEIWADEELNYCPHCGRKVKWDADGA